MLLYYFFFRKHRNLIGRLFEKVKIENSTPFIFIHLFSHSFNKMLSFVVYIYI